MMTMTKTPEGAAPNAPASTPPTPAPAGLARAFWAMVRKEVRETGLVAALIAAACSLLLAVILYERAKQLSGMSVYEGDTMAIPTPLLSITVLAGPVAALILGFMQFFVESHPGRLAFLVHRPVSRTRLFAFKAAVGLALYVLALGVPLLVALWWASNPANVPLPFLWRMGLAPLADIWSGIPYYFAAVLVAVRTDARWLGSRLLPIAAPVLASLLDIAAYSFVSALIAPMVAIIAMVLAAQAYFFAAGQYGRMPAYARTLTGAALAFALMVVGMLCLALLLTLEDSLPQNERVWSYVQFAQDGTPLIQRQDSGRITFTDLDGRPWTGSFENLEFPYNPNWQRYDNVQFHEARAYFISARNLGNEWFQAMPLAGGDYLVGYDRRTRKLIGAIGANGLEKDVAVPQTRFATPMRLAASYSVTRPVNAVRDNATLLSAGTTLYQLHYDGTLREQLKTSSPIQELGNVTTTVRDAERNATVTRYPMLVTREEVLVLSPILPGETPAVRVRYPKAGLDAYDIRGVRLPATGQYLLWFTPVVARTQPNWQPPLAVYFTADGTKEREIQLPELNNSTPSLATLRYVVPLVIPPAFGATILPWQWSWALPGEPRAELQQQTVECVIAALVFAAATFYLTRRRALETRAVWLWSILALLLGPLGLVLLLCLRGLPALTRCHACSRRLRVDQNQCPACGTPVPPPAPTGTEVIAA
jgi:hypothetical protein